ncbi:MAG: peptidoglycan DD-metalloendopeptidase family protein [Boseongicola sp.]|nr:MAG: peptidoglycan DD-metalloendopeptidase family protein [Boseongicola sp.]
MRLPGLALTAWLGTLGSVAAETPAELAQVASDYMAQAAVALAEADGAQDRIQALTATVQAYEKGLAALREGLRGAALQERVLSARLQGHDEELTELLGVLQLIEREGPAAGLLHPEGPLPAIRAGMLASDLVPALNARAAILVVELEDLRAVIALQTAGQTQLQSGLRDIRAARLMLSEAISNRTDLPPATATDDATMQALINSTETLTAFADAFATDSPWSGTLKETWDLPVLGRVLRRFNEKDAAGVARPGWVVAAENSAVVTAPTPGTVRFAGALRDYGGVVILEPRAGELLILGGLGQVYVRRNQIVETGAPLALMGGVESATQEKLIENSVGGGQVRRETLYIEIRQGRDAIDPAARFEPDA